MNNPPGGGSGRRPGGVGCIGTPPRNLFRSITGGTLIHFSIHPILVQPFTLTRLVGPHVRALPVVGSRRNLNPILFGSG